MRSETGIALTVAGLTVLAGLLLYVQHGGPVTEEGGIAVVMCPDCEQAFALAVSSGEARCALYDVGQEMGGVLERAGAQVITDDESRPAYGEQYRHSGLMHHKFCVVNDTLLLSGSYNPTDNGERNRNNLLLISSPTLARNYKAELGYLLSGESGRVRHVVLLSGIRIENYFCPRDSCEEHVLEALAAANSSVRYMTYSFTSDAIGELLLQKGREGVFVEGVCDGGQLNDYNECERLGARIYDRPELLHHKVFIIDERIVITGSYNPTASGNERNNENVLIIHSEEVAQEFLTEYAAVQAFAAQ